MVADIYDVLVSDRPYRKGRGQEQPIRILREESGTHIWPPTVEALLRSLAKRIDNEAQQPRRVAQPCPPTPTLELRHRLDLLARALLYHAAVSSVFAKDRWYLRPRVRSGSPDTSGIQSN